jgi:hypothetical protein
VSRQIQDSISLIIPVSGSIEESKTVLSESVLTNPRNKSLFSSAMWHGDTLHVESVFGKGTLQVTDNKLLIEISLTLLGLAVKSTMISELQNRITQAFEDR